MYMCTSKRRLKELPHFRASISYVAKTIMITVAIICDTVLPFLALLSYFSQLLIHQLLPISLG